MTLAESLKSNLIGDIDPNLLVLKLILALALILIGIAIGRLINAGLKKIFVKISLEKKIKTGICDLIRAIIRWSVYIAFFIFGISQFGISITRTISNVLITIPSFVGALVILIVGFGLAHFLKKIINESGARQVNNLSEIIFYFVVYVSGVYALKTVFIPLDYSFSNNLILVLTASLGIGGTYFFLKKHFESKN